MSDNKQWRFDALDSWFFREARAFDTSGGNELVSLFPPPARTVAGAVRTLIGEMHEVDWERFALEGESADLKRMIGVGDDLGQVNMTGPYPLWEGKRLYPVPLHLLAQDRQYVFLKPGEPVDCDLSLDSPRPRGEGCDLSLDSPLPLGEGLGVRAKPVRLPEKPKDGPPGAKPLEDVWLDGTDLHRVLSGQFPEKVYRSSELYDVEPRLGIARNNARRTANDGLLYQTRHLRPRPELSIGVTVSGIPADSHPECGVIRFGGEGRPSAVTVDDAPPRLTPLEIHGQNMLLMLLTHADFGGGWLLPGFKPDTQGDVKVWRGQLHGVELMLHSAVLGKAAREGGWDLLRKQPRPVRSLIPAGSVYFCTVTGDARAAATALHGGHVGCDTALGRGELAVGLWKS